MASKYAQLIALCEKVMWAATTDQLEGELLQSLKEEAEWIQEEINAKA